MPPACLLSAKQSNSMRVLSALLLFFLSTCFENVFGQEVKQTETRGVIVTRDSTGAPDFDKMPGFHAFLLAEDKYADTGFRSLPGTLKDIRRIYNTLSTEYTFEPANIDILINASKAEILSKLNAKAKTLTENDNLFIFYAGFGWMKKDAETGREEGYLVPSDAVKGDEVSFINNYDITSILNRCMARHILFAADASFAGSLFRDVSGDLTITAKDAYREKSRRLLTSGNEQVRSYKSDFVEYFRQALQDNREKYMTAGRIIDSFKDIYIEKTHKFIQYTPIPNVDDQGGEFVFFRRK